MSDGSTKKQWWTLRQVAEAKRAIKAELDQVEVRKGRAERLKWILGQIGKLDDSMDPADLLHRLVYIMSALVYHERYGGLTPSNVDRFAELAIAILTIRGVKPVSSKLAFLHGELHLVLSQIHRKKGDHWRAAWEQQLSQILSSTNPTGGPGFQALSFGLRCLRLGNGEAATHHLTAASQARDLGPGMRLKAHLALARIHRVCRNWSQALAVHERVRDQVNQTSGEVAFEWLWERRCLDAQQQGSPRPLYRLLDYAPEQGKSSYYMELYLWRDALGGAFQEMKLPRIRTLQNNQILGSSTPTVIKKVMGFLESLKDKELSFHQKLADMGSVVQLRAELLTVDHELLLLAICTRWLKQRRVASLADLCLQDYRMLCMRLSGDSNDDLLDLGLGEEQAGSGIRLARSS